jgi:2-polyprenyl-6-methoxyphenol hydroxylase-like FAD-dependent oxidoreductase
VAEPVLVVGGGIGGLTLALSLHQAGVACRVFEAAPEIQPLGVGINLLPHGMREFTELGLQAQLAALAVETQELSFYNRYGQFIFREPRGRHAGYEWPQLSIHRADLHEVLLEETGKRLGAESVVLNRKCISIEQSPKNATIKFQDGSSATGSCAIGCDGIHSSVRRMLFPGEGPPAYQGINMWRGVTRMKPFLTGASMATAGWLEVGKMVMYPIRKELDAQGRQLINWVAEIQSPRNVMQDWNLGGKIEDFYPTFEKWRFDWLDCAALIRDADQVLEYPMVDRDPLPYWTQGRITLLGDAAHPMYPRGSQGAAQALIDARALAESLHQCADPIEALQAYEKARLEPTAKIVRTNRQFPPDYIIMKVDELTGGRPFGNIDDVISQDELRNLSEQYKKIAGFSLGRTNG